jgi:NAD(P)-dependent dehydrogenase (short-subunit alcohol dehydrogenase family)
MSATVDPSEFAGKRVLVSGGTKGLGRATVERFLAGGARVTGLGVMKELASCYRRSGVICAATTRSGR